jgi:dolichol-phosphate hexosyltransferase
MKPYQKITILIPCHNEEKGIGSVIEAVPTQKLKELGYVTEIIVINNHSTDQTEKIALKHQVTVISEPQKGKGFAIKKAFNSIPYDTDIVIMIDGDNTYKTKEIPRLIEPIESGFCDVVIGSRLGGKIRQHSLKLPNRIANWFYTFLVRQFYRANITDVLSGFFAWKLDVVAALNQHLDATGFEIEMEMITKMVKLGFEIYSVPITYDLRAGESKLSGFKDGLIILRTFALNLWWSPDREKMSWSLKFPRTGLSQD